MKIVFYVLQQVKHIHFPQFKETAPFKYQDVSFSSQGNPDLKPSR